MHLQLHTHQSHKRNITQRSVNSIKALSVIAASILTMSCATSTSQPAASVSNRVIQPTEQAATPQAQPQQTRPTPSTAQRNINVERAEYYQRLASNTDEQARIDAQLNSAENYIQAQDFYNAEQQSIALQGLTLNKTQTDRLAIINAYVQYQRQDYRGALRILSSVTDDLFPAPEEVSTPNTDVALTDDTTPNSDLTTASSAPQNRRIEPKKVQAISIQQVDALLLSSFSHQKLGDYESAIAALLKRENALIGDARTETTRYIWQVIDTIDTEQRSQLIANSRNPLVRNRLEQSLQGQISQNSVAPREFTQWQAEPVNNKLQTINSSWSESSPQKIAVLLPLTSKFNKAAQALLDGIKHQNELNDSQFSPQIQVYDIGQNPNQVTQYYAAAINAGADFIIGPLGKEYANRISNQGRQRVPTILLGGDNPVGGSMLRFTMSPEAEGARIAERALNDGHLTAAILTTDTAVNQRIISSFSNHWLRAGGKISTVANYNTQQYDHSSELKQLFDIGSSESRYRSLSDTLGFKPKFTAHQRKDLDFIIMLADNESGRIVRPQINFFSGSKIPVYASSGIYNGIPNSINNIDLDDTIFPIMPWVFKSRDSASYAGQLNRLFAMGADAYEVAGNFTALRADSELALKANTGQVSIGQSSEITSKPLWAKFVKGEASLIETLGFDLSPIEKSATLFNGDVNAQGSSNGKGVYNDKTWDSRESRRKTSP